LRHAVTSVKMATTPSSFPCGISTTPARNCQTLAAAAALAFRCISR
jgi:hypothetical protein